MRSKLPVPDQFNIRVYGIFIRDEKVLLVRENLRGFEFTKFPGGGLEFGEGLLEGLSREILEELGMESRILGHFYTTDFFQRSAFRGNEQLLSVYYRLDIPECPEETEFPLVFHPEEQHRLEFYWVDLKKVNPEEVTFPVDKQVVEMLIRQMELNF